MSDSNDKEWYSFYWKIKDFSLRALETNHGLHSPDFKTPATGCNTFLELEVLSTYGEEHELVVRVQKSSGEGIPSQFQCELSFLAANGMVLQNLQVKKIDESASNPSIFHEFSYPHSKIFGSERHLFLPQNTLVLCCRIPLYGMPSSQCFTRTVLHSHDFLWKIPHITCAQPILTKLFQIASHKFAISLFKGLSPTETGTIDIQVSLKHGGSKQSFASYNFSVVDDKGEDLCTFNFIDFSPSDSGYCKRIKIVLENKFLINNTLSLKWVFNVGVGEIMHEDLPPLSDPLALQVGNDHYQKYFNSTWREDFERMYKDQLFCDVVLKAGKASFSAHKIVLCNRSPVFRDMLVGSMLNNQLDIINIPDIEPAIVDQMLLYVYTDFLGDIHSEEAAKLYYAAHKYALQNLKLQCISIMFGELSLFNVCSILDLAFSHQDEGLLMSVRDFIWKDDMVISTREWRDLELNKPWLAIKLFRMLHFKSKGQLLAT